MNFKVSCDLSTIYPGDRISFSPPRLTAADDFTRLRWLMAMHDTLGMEIRSLRERLPASELEVADRDHRAEREHAARARGERGYR